MKTVGSGTPSHGSTAADLRGSSSCCVPVRPDSVDTHSPGVDHQPMTEAVTVGK